MKCSQCRYNTLCFSGQLFNAHVTIWCPDCQRLQVRERILAPGVRMFKRAAPSDPHTILTAPAAFFQSGKKPFRYVHFVFECCERNPTYPPSPQSGLILLGITDYVDDPGPPQISEWKTWDNSIEHPKQSYGRTLGIHKCVVCDDTEHEQLPVSVRNLDTETPEQPPKEKRSEDD